MSQRNIADVAQGPFANKIIDDLSFGLYSHLPAMNASTLKRGFVGKAVSMKHLRHAYEQGVFEDSPQMQFGRMLHCLMFERDSFSSRYASYDGRRDRRTKDYQEFLAKHPGVEVVKEYGQYSMHWALQAGVAIANTPTVGPYIAAGKPEVTVLAEVAGIQCRGRLDWLATDLRTITDMKSASDVSPEGFGRQFFRLKYDLQLGLYQHLFQVVQGEKWPVVCIVAENHPPFDVVIYEVPAAVLDQGLDTALRLLRKLGECIRTGEWPGVAAGEPVVQLFVPQWEMEETVEWDEPAE